MVATPTYKIISIAGEQWTVGRKRSTRVARTYYVSGVNFKDGPGLEVARVHSTADRTKAARFSTATAETIAAQLADRYRFGLFPTIETAA